MSRTRSRLLALAVSLGISALLVVAYLAVRPTPASISFHDPEFVPADERGQRDHRPTSDGSLVRFPISRKEAHKLFNIRPNLRAWDPDAYFVYKPHRNRTFPWAEHPRAQYRLRTDALGLHRDGEIAEIAPRLRVLVTGDSHVDGVCGNRESLCGVLEARLNARHGKDASEVLNAAAGGYNFYHYLGVLERFLRLDIVPDMFVVVVYGGNDFGGATLLYHYFRGLDRPPTTSPDRLELRRDLIDEYGAHFAQGLFDVEQARFDPRSVEIMRSAAREVTVEIQRLCHENEIELLVCYLPSVFQLPGRGNDEVVREMVNRLEMQPADLAILDENGDAFIALLDEIGVEPVDLRTTLIEVEGDLYWHEDSHINLRAHESIAEALLPFLERELEER